MFLSLNPVLRGALLSFIAFVIWSCSDALTKAAGLDGVSVPLIIEIASWSAALTVFLGLAIKGNLARLRPRNLKVHGSLIPLFVLLSIVNIISFTNLPMTTVYVALFSSPFLISFFGSLFLGEPLSRKQVVAIAIGFCGVLLALFPEGQRVDGGEANLLLGYLALPFFVLFYVAEMIVLRTWGQKETSESIAFIPYFMRAALFLPFLWVYPVTDLSLRTFLFLVLMGSFGGIGFLLMAAAYKLAPVAIVSPFHYVQIVVGALFGYFVWGEAPSVWVWAGGVLIVASGLLVAHEARRLERVKDSLLLKEMCETEALL